jgi:hypothetical protein
MKDPTKRKEPGLIPALSKSNHQLDIECESILL